MFTVLQCDQVSSMLVYFVSKTCGGCGTEYCNITDRRKSGGCVSGQLGVYTCLHTWYNKSYTNKMQIQASKQLV